MALFVTPWFCLWLPGPVSNSPLHPSPAEQGVAWHCRPSDTNPGWAQQHRMARGWHLISCFPGVYLPACSLLLQITVECTGVWSSMQKMETAGWRSCSWMLTWGETEKRIFELPTKTGELICSARLIHYWNPLLCRVGTWEEVWQDWGTASNIWMWQSESEISVCASL